MIGNSLKERKIAVAYVRVSTIGQGQDITNQIEPLKAFASARGFEIKTIYEDVGISGATERRKGLDALLADAKRGSFKHLLVMEISRLARDVRHLLNTLHEFERLGVEVVSVREGIEFSSPMGRAMVAMIGILMSVERELLSERIKSALETKKLIAERTGSNWKMGRPTKLTPQLAEQVFILRRDEGLSIRQIAKRLEIAKSSVQRVLAQKGGNTGGGTT